MIIATTSSNDECSPLDQFSFPRTGKRGVPQQFPRRLYEMLDRETKSLEADSNHPKVIAWSYSGRAFRIHDVVEFSETILPKYFRTKKLSSFQRNLNLYGFSKVRRGEAQAYAHPSFVRDQPESLLDLRKTTPAQRRRIVSADASLPKNQQKREPLNPRSVSPIPASISDIVLISAAGPADKLSLSLVSPVAPRIVLPDVPKDDRGKLDLLTFALEHEFANRP